MKKIAIIILVALGVYQSLVAMKPTKNVSEDKFSVKAVIEAKEIDCVLGNKFFGVAHAQEIDLRSKDVDCFTPSFIKDREKAMKKLGELGGKHIEFSRENFQAIHCTFFDRKSGTLLVIGPGFPVERQRMLPLVELFQCDLLLFDYPGTGAEHEIGISSFFLPWRWKGLLSWSVAKVDFNTSGLGTTEEEDLISVVDGLKKKKQYKHVFGLAFCFSSYVFARAATKRADLFEKLIFDGSWPSIERVIRTIVKNPSLVCSVEDPRSPLPCVTHCGWFQSFFVALLEWVVWVNIKTAPLKQYLSELKCPILFFQCFEDCYCNESEFSEIWNSVKTNKVAILTKNLHGRNHVKQAEGYKVLSQTFFDLSGKEFAEKITGWGEKPSLV